nr:zinc finger BED domain-containing protein RICESLEEPER 2-like [Tanacetum cinerariifolium]
MMKRVISFEEFPSPHTGHALFKMLVKVLTNFNLKDKVMPITLDNASNNISAMNKLKLNYDPPMGEEFQQPEFEGYGPKTSKCVSKDIFNEVKESPDASLVKELVSNDKLEKKTVFPIVTKIEFVRPKQQEKSIRKPVKNLMEDMQPLGEEPKEGKLLVKELLKLVLLKVPRKNNMYSVDMKNIVPKESLTCLVAKATLDESML